jgi:hypothetical protein
MWAAVAHGMIPSCRPFGMVRLRVPIHGDGMSYPKVVDLPVDLRLIDDMHLGRPHVIGTYLMLGDAPA